MQELRKISCFFSNKYYFDTIFAININCVIYNKLLKYEARDNIVDR